MICRVCNSTDLELTIDLGNQPWCNGFLTRDQIGKEPFYPLRVLYCHSCCTAQLDHTVSKETMFADHTYLSGITSTLSAHFRSVAEEVDRSFFAGTHPKAALDIGSNDGTQLKHYKALGYEILGIESSKTPVDIARRDGVETIHGFFNHDLAKTLGRRFQIINASGVFFHLEELHSVTEGIRECLRDDGVFVVQFLYMKSIVENGAFDQIYHEHLLYYTLQTIEDLLHRHGLEMFDARLSPIHGGSIIGFASHAGRFSASDRLVSLRNQELANGTNDIVTYVKFAERIKDMKEINIRYLEAAKADGKQVFGFGAPAKGNTMLNYFGIGTNYLDCLVEKNELRKGLFSPGTHIPIVLERDVQTPPNIYFVLAWNFKDEILARNEHVLNSGTEFYFPVNPQ